MADYNPTPNVLPAAVDLVDDGGPREAAEVNLPVETALDAIAWNKQQIYAGPLYIPLESPVVSTRFTSIPRNGFAEWHQNNLADGGELAFAVPSGHAGARLTALEVLFGHTGSHTALPETKPRVQLLTRDNGATPNPGSAGEIVDTFLAPADVDEYETYRWVTFAIGAGVVFSNDADYALVISGEFGTDSKTGLFVAAARILTASPE